MLAVVICHNFGERSVSLDGSSHCLAVQILLEDALKLNRCLTSWLTFVHGLTHLRIVPVEIWLFFGKQPEIPLISRCVVLPGTPFELGLPIIWRLLSFGTVRLLRGLALVPDVLVALR